MRRHRVRNASMGLVVAGLVALAPTGPATAQSRALPDREISSRVADIRNQLFLKGNVSPGWAGKPVIIQKKKCKGKRCQWFASSEVTTNDRGGFRARIAAPRDGYWYWRAKVRKGGGYGTSYSSTWRTFTS